MFTTKYKRMKNTFSLQLSCLLFILFFSQSCGKKDKTVIDPAFKAYISAFTSGTISSESPISIRLANDVIKNNETGQVIDKSLFEFTPSIKGTAVWKDERTIEFRPAGRMTQGILYKVTFRLGEVMKVPEKFKDFSFDFQIIKQSFEVHKEGLFPLDNRNFNKQYLTGNLVTADVADADKVEKILKASQRENELPIRWTHDAAGRIHTFTVDSIVRTEDSSHVVLSWNGSPLGLELTGSDTATVPALGDFTLMDARVVQQETDQYLLLQFSDHLDESQNLKGLITLGGMSDFRFVIEGNTIRVYPPTRQTTLLTLTIDASLKNGLGKPMKENISRNIQFEEIKPSLRLSGKGVILPGSSELMFPFEAVNLKSVDVKIVKIFSDNISQFLQVNDMESSNELTRVGRVVYNKSVSLASLKQTDFTKWNQYALDLSELIKTDPGAIYRVTISFKKKYSLYPCMETDSSALQKEELQEENWDDAAQKESSSWDFVEDYYDENENYQWTNRDDPCKKEYYSSNRWISRNVLSSDLGIIAKRGSDGSMLVVVNDIKNTNPLPGVTIEIYNLQRQIIKKLNTNSNGMAEVTITDKPFLLIAKKDEQRGYLKLDDGSSLSMSMFDVAGEKVQKGIKGFIYGERGVWRPGDSLYITFILDNKQQALPDNYPVTFELYNPLGQLTRRMTSTTSIGGFYSFQTVTDEEAPTGNWEAKVKAGPATFTKNIRIETIMPNRLKIKFDFAKKFLSKGLAQSAELEARWLHGAIARNLKANVEVSLSAGNTTFPKYSEYAFDDPTRTFSSDKQVLFEGQLNELGKANVEADIAVETAAPGMLQANFVTKAFEPGGNFSIDRFAIPYHPYEEYTGIQLPKGDKARGMLLTDTNHLVKIVSVDKYGNPVQGKRKIEVEFYQIEWRWWWDKSTEDLSNYNNSRFHRFIKIDTITVVNGQGSWTLRETYPSWGRYLLRARDIETGHSTGKVFYMDWPGWAGRGQREQGGGSASMLSFSSDKEKYLVGEEVVLNIPTSENSRALISIESGTKILKIAWLIGKKGESQYRFTVTPDMTPNVYVYVTLLQPHAQVQNDLPIRLYGVIPLLIENPGTHIQPILSLPAVLKPEESFKVSVREQKGNEMVYTLAMVDDGLLDLTRFKTPDAWSSFYAREALGVKSWDLYDNVMGAWGGRLERILSIGGDEGLSKPKDGKKANRFKPVVKFLGPFFLKKRETASHSIEMPQYVGSVRVMVVAGNNGAYGLAEKSVPVKKPLMILATLPRVLGPGETAELPVTVFALENQVKDVKVEIIPNGIFSAEKGLVKNIHFNTPGDDLVNFGLKVKSMIGVGSVKIIATSGKERAETNVELNVLNRNPRMATVIDTVLDAGQNWNGIYKAVGVAGTNNVMLELSSVPPINLGKRLDYLIHYPYGCIEQTTSSVFPQLYLSDIMDLSPQKKQETEKNIKAGIERLKLFLLPSGGLSYWPGESKEDDYATNYGGHFLIEAEQKGFSLPAGMMEQWKKYQRNRATSWTYTDDQSAILTQTYRLYTLALIKSPELGSMNRLREKKNLPNVARWSLAAAYQIAGQTAAAAELIAGLPLTFKNYSELSGSYGSDERDEAIILETLSLMNKRSEALPVMKALSESLCSNQWMSTHTTAYTLLAIAKYTKSSRLSTSLEFSYKLNSAKEQPVNTQAVMKQIELKLSDAANGNYSVTNKGKNPIFARLILSGIPSTDDQTASQNGLTLKIDYKSIDGKDIDVTNMTQGTDFYAEATVTNTAAKVDYNEMALTQLFPSGWEIMNSRLDQSAGEVKNSEFRYQDIRDDRVNTFFDLESMGKKTFRIYLNASYLGNYYLPAVSCEAMYDATINARIPGKWITIGTKAQPVDLSKK